MSDLLARLKWTRDRWQDVREDADAYARELFGRPANEIGGLLGGIRALADNEVSACDAAIAGAISRLSDTSPKWTRTDDKNPEDEQRVIGHYGAGDEEVETLVYHAADAPDGPEEWTDVWGELRDRPMFWMPVEALGRPK